MIERSGLKERLANMTEEQAELLQMFFYLNSHNQMIATNTIRSVYEMQLQREEGSGNDDRIPRKE